jgi:hypothetical protein
MEKDEPFSMEWSVVVNYQCMKTTWMEGWSRFWMIFMDVDEDCVGNAVLGSKWSVVLVLVMDALQRYRINLKSS